MLRVCIVMCVRFCDKDFNELNNDLYIAVILYWGAQYMMCVFLFYELSIMYGCPWSYEMLCFVFHHAKVTGVLKHEKVYTHS